MATHLIHEGPMTHQGGQKSPKGNLNCVRIFVLVDAVGGLPPLACWLLSTKSSPTGPNKGINLATVLHTTYILHTSAWG